MRRASAAPSDQVKADIDPGEWSAPPIEKGEAHRVSAIIDRTAFRRFEVLKEKNLFPWETFSDFTRYAIHLALERASRAVADPDLVRDLKTERETMALRNVIDREDRIAKHLATSMTALRKMCEAKDDSAPRLAKQILKGSETYPGRWRRKFVAAVKEICTAEGVNYES